jgi:hypothetical protein
MSKGTVNIPITHYDDLKSIIGKWKELHTQAINKIAELEKRLSNAETMGDKEQSIRDLEQQVMGRLDGVSYALNMYCTTMSPKEFPPIGEYYAGQLQAKSLKEQE